MHPSPSKNLCNSQPAVPFEQRTPPPLGSQDLESTDFCASRVISNPDWARPVQVGFKSLVSNQFKYWPNILRCFPTGSRKMDEKVMDLSENGGYHQMTPPNGKYDVENIPSWFLNLLDTNTWSVFKTRLVVPSLRDSRDGFEHCSPGGSLRR